MPEGGRLALSTGRSLLLEALPADPDEVPPGRWTVLEVADTGHGIPAGIRSRIFEPFFTSRAQSGGTGMGLASVYGIIRQSGGYVLVESEPGRGTRFRILLPRIEGAVSEEAASPPSGITALAESTGTLLLVEDQASLRQLAERALQRAGWTVVSAEDGEAALALVEEGLRPVALVSDVIMPGMDGAALKDRLRGIISDLPVLLVSGYAPSMVKGGIAEARLAYLPKPYRPAELVEAIRALLQA